MYRFKLCVLWSLFWLLSSCEQRQEILMVPLEDTHEEASLEWVDVASDAQHVAQHIDREARWLVAQAAERAKCMSDAAHRKPHVLTRSKTDGVKAMEKGAAEERHKSKRIDLNTASLSQLQKLPRVGPVLAQAIVDARPYRTIHDLKGVRGVGAKTFDAMRPMLHVSENE